MSIHSALTIHRSRLLATALGVVALLATACTDDSGWSHSGPGPTAPRSALATPVALERMQDCDQLAAHARSTMEHALDASGMGNGDTLIRSAGDDGEGVDGFAAEESIAAAPAGDNATGTEAPELVGTNNQELGVEEADLVDLDAERLVWVDGGVLRIAELDADVTVDGAIDLGDRGPSDLFLRGDRVLVLGAAHGGAGPTTTLTIVSIEDPSTPRVVESTDVEGELVTARQIDGVARVILRSWPRPLGDLPAPTTRLEADALLDDLDGEQLLPRRWDDGAASPLGDCADVAVLPAGPDPGPGAGPTEPASVSVLRVADSLADLAPVTVQGTVETVYASTSALYVAASGWDDRGETTSVHRFDLSGEGPATHTGSGVVPGRLLNQFALSERSGHLRVVTTIDEMVEFFDEPAPGEAVGAIAPMPVSEGRLTVLDVEGPLDEVGHVDGLGPNEEVHSVRFVDDLAYVVTFRRTDPLYAIDLSDPTNPTVLGELKITGFSEYLHPVGGGMLLGVGREVDETTGMDEGMKVSLFDISDPTALAEVDRFVLPDAWSPVGSGDHRGFTWDPTRNRAIIPTETAALVVQVDGPTLTTVAELSHPSQRGPVGPNRSRLHDGTIWTISPAGLGGTDADSPDGVEMVS